MKKLKALKTKATTKMSTRSHVDDLWGPNSPFLRRCFRTCNSCGARGATKGSVLNLTMNPQANQTRAHVVGPAPARPRRYLASM